jgi:hypothetical protein
MHRQVLGCKLVTSGVLLELVLVSAVAAVQVLVLYCTTVPVPVLDYKY